MSSLQCDDFLGINVKLVFPGPACCAHAKLARNAVPFGSMAIQRVQSNSCDTVRETSWTAVQEGKNELSRVAQEPTYTSLISDGPQVCGWAETRSAMNI